MEPREHFGAGQTATVNRDEREATADAPLSEPHFESLTDPLPDFHEFEVPPPPIPPGWPDLSIGQHFTEGHRDARAPDRIASESPRRRLFAAAAACLGPVRDHAPEATRKLGAVAFAATFALLMVAGYSVIPERDAPTLAATPHRHVETLIAANASGCTPLDDSRGCAALVATKGLGAQQRVAETAAPPSGGAASALGETSGSAMPRSATAVVAARALEDAATGSVRASPALETPDTAQAADGAARPRPPFISELQARLVALGYNLGNIDGSFGRRTVVAVKKFQRDHGARPDGILSDALIERIMAARPRTQDMRALERPGARG